MAHSWHPVAQLRRHTKGNCYGGTEAQLRRHGGSAPCSGVLPASSSWRDFTSADFCQIPKTAPEAHPQGVGRNLASPKERLAFVPSCWEVTSRPQECPLWSLWLGAAQSDNRRKEGLWARLSGAGCRGELTRPVRRLGWAPLLERAACVPSCGAPGGQSQTLSLGTLLDSAWCLTFLGGLGFASCGNNEIASARGHFSGC